MHFESLRRREFITLLAALRFAWPPWRRAQQDGQVRHIGRAHGTYRERILNFQNYLSAFRQALRKLGWIEGPQHPIETRGGRLMTRIQGNDPRRNPRTAARRLLTQNTTPHSVDAAANAYRPIVFVIVAIQSGSGFVESPFPLRAATPQVLLLWSRRLSGKWLSCLGDRSDR